MSFGDARVGRLVSASAGAVADLRAQREVYRAAEVSAAAEERKAASKRVLEVRRAYQRRQRRAARYWRDNGPRRDDDDDDDNDGPRAASKQAQREGQREASHKDEIKEIVTATLEAHEASIDFAKRPPDAGNARRPRTHDDIDYLTRLQGKLDATDRALGALLVKAASRAPHTATEGDVEHLEVV